MEKQAKKKETIEFKNSPEILSKTLSELPNILLYVSEDSLEFDILVTHYKNLFKKNGEQFETITYVPDEEDIGKLFMELFNYSMFASWKLILIREGNDFFKTFTKEGKKDLYNNFKINIPYGMIGPDNKYSFDNMSSSSLNTMPWFSSIHPYFYV